MILQFNFRFKYTHSAESLSVKLVGSSSSKLTSVQTTENKTLF